MFLKTVLALLFIIKLRMVPDNLPNYDHHKASGYTRSYAACIENTATDRQSAMSAQTLPQLENGHH